MNNIDVTVRYRGEKATVPTQPDIVLEDFLDQLAERGVLGLPAGQHWVVTLGDCDTALRPGQTLAKNGVQDGDVLNLAPVTKGG